MHTVYNSYKLSANLLVFLIELSFSTLKAGILHKPSIIINLHSCVKKRQKDLTKWSLFKKCLHIFINVKI